MKQQVVIMHGGNTFKDAAAFREQLMREELSIDDLRAHPDWKSTLQADLGHGYEVLLPRLPNKQNASYEEWSIVFVKMLKLLDPSAIFVGHSLGGIFLAKYLAEHTLAHPIKAVILLAAPFDGEGTEILGGFSLPSSLDLFAAQVESIHLLHSEDDPVVPLRALEQYQRVLPRAQVHRFATYKHFNTSQFPELSALIRTIV